LRDGDMWFQSLNKDDTFKIQTANSIIDYQGGEAIITYDSLKGKTQLMVINGLMKLSNLRNTELNLSVSEGHFSFVENSYEDGMPRDPTPVGEKTYAQLVSLFSGVAPMDKNAVRMFKDENVAHTSSEPKAEPKEEKLKVERKIASVVSPDDSVLIEEYKNNLLNKHSKLTAPKKKNLTEVKSHVVHAAPKQIQPKSTQPTGNIVHIYGLKSTSEAPKPNPEVNPVLANTHVPKMRAPASVSEENVSIEEDAPASVNPFVKDRNAFTKESNKLIDDLKKL